MLDWLRRLFDGFGSRQPMSRPAAPPKDEVKRRLEVAMARSRQEIAALEGDGAALAARIQRNAAGGRATLGGGKPL